MKIKRYMKPYTCGELQENLKRDKRKLADLEKQWNEKLKYGRETLANDAYDLWEDNLFEWYMPQIRTVESRIEYWKSRIRKRQFTHKKKAS